MVQEAEASQRLNEFLKIEPEIKTTTNKSSVEGSIAFENVSFTYNDTKL
jgi:ATP-binding cassette subfamily B protein